MNIFEEAIVPETPKALPNEQLFIYVPIGTIDNPGIVTFDGVDFRIDEHGRVYMKVSSTKNAKDIIDIFALLYGYREGEPAEGEEPGAVLASVKAVDQKAQANAKSIAANADDIDLLEEARPITGSITILSADWRVTEAEGFHYEVFAELPNAPISGSDVVLLAPETDKTRVDSTDMSVTVSSAVSNGVLTDGLRFYSRIVPTAPLHYRYVIIKQGKDDDGTSLAVAAIVGITDVPQYVRDRLMALRERLDGIDSALEEHRADIDTNATALTALTARIDNPAHGLSAVEHKIDNFLYGVTDEARDQLSEVLGLIDANADAIETFKNMGGAPVGSGTLVVPMDQWNDETPTGAMVALPANTMHAGSVMLLTPANDATKEAASKARLTVSVDISGDSGGNVKDYVVLLRAETAYKPAIDMEFAFVILQTTAETSLVTLIGVDAAGSPAPTSVDLSAFDPDENGKGYITETYGEGEDAPKKVTEVTYDEAGNIIKIGNTAINWGGEA